MTKILLIIGGGIAAYKSLELIRILKTNGADVKTILTDAGEKFVTPISVEALSENKVHKSLWDEPMAHISLARGLDAVIIAPATAGILARLANGYASDLASTAFLALPSDVLVFAAPAMNPQMWENPATIENVATLKSRGVKFIEPCNGSTACGEVGVGRMAEALMIANTLLGERPLSGKKAVVTSGSTWEAIDPVRVIANRSSGRQGHAIAAALCAAGADTTLISGQVTVENPHGVNVVKVESARDMLCAVKGAMPADIFVGAAAVADWSPVPSDKKIKKQGGKMPEIQFRENEDIVKYVANLKTRPSIVIAFAAETNDLLANAQKKLSSKGVDFVVANEVGQGKAFNTKQNQVYLLDKNGNEKWELMDKTQIARKLVAKVSDFLIEK